MEQVYDFPQESVVYVTDLRTLASFEAFVQVSQLVAINPRSSLLLFAMKSLNGEVKVFILDMQLLDNDSSTVEKLNSSLSELFTNKNCLKVCHRLGGLKYFNTFFGERLTCFSDKIETIISIEYLFLFLYRFELKFSASWMMKRLFRTELIKSGELPSDRPLSVERIMDSARWALVIFQLYAKLSNDLREFFPDRDLLSDFAVTGQITDLYRKSHESFAKLQSIYPVKGTSLSLVREELGIPDELLLDIAKELSPISVNQPYTTIASIHERYFPSHDITDIRRLFCDDFRFMVIDDYLFRYPTPFENLGMFRIDERKKLFGQEVIYHLLAVRGRKLTIEEAIQYLDKEYSNVAISGSLSTLKSFPAEQPVFYQDHPNYHHAIAFALDFNHFLAKDAALIEKELQEILECDLQHLAAIESIQSLPLPEIEREQLLEAIYQYLQRYQEQGDPQQQHGVVTLSALQAQFNRTMDSKDLYKHRFVLIKDQVFPTQMRIDASASQSSNEFDPVAYYLSVVYYLLKTSQLQLTSPQLLSYLRQRFPKQNNFIKQCIDKLAKDPRFLTVRTRHLEPCLFEVREPMVDSSLFFPTEKSDKQGSTTSSEITSTEVSLAALSPLPDTSTTARDPVLSEDGVVMRKQEEAMEGPNHQDEINPSPSNRGSVSSLGVKEIPRRRSMAKTDKAFKKDKPRKLLSRLRSKSPRERTTNRRQEEIEPSDSAEDANSSSKGKASSKGRPSSRSESSSFFEPLPHPGIALLLNDIAKYLHEELSEEGKLEGVEIKRIYDRFVKDHQKDEEMPIKKLTDLYWHLEHDIQHRFIVLDTTVYPFLRDLNKCWIPVSPIVKTMDTYYGQRRYLELCRERYLEDQVVVEKIYHWIRLRGGRVTLDELYRVMANRHGGIFRYVRQLHQGQSFSAFIKFTLRKDPRLEVNFDEYPKKKSTVCLKEQSSNHTGGKGSILPSGKGQVSSTLIPTKTPPSSSLRESIQKIVQTSSSFLKKIIK